MTESFLALLSFLIVIALFVLIIRSRPKTAASAARTAVATSDPDAERELERLRQVKFGELKPIDAPNIVRHSNETFYWCNVAELYMPQKHSYRVGAYGGPSVRLARGLYWRTGTSRGQTITETSVDRIDIGSLYLSNLRALFVGVNGSREIPYKNILSIHPFNNGVRFDLANVKTFQFKTGDPACVIVLSRIISNDLQAKPALAVDPSRIIDEVSEELSKTNPSEEPPSP